MRCARHGEPDSRWAIRIWPTSPTDREDGPALTRTRTIGLLLGGFVLLAGLFAQLGPAQILSLIASLRGNLAVIVALFVCHECTRALAIRFCVAIEQRPPFQQVVAGFMLRVPEVHGPLRVLCHVLCWSSLVYVCSVAGALMGRVHLMGAILRRIGALPVVRRWVKADP